jgi:hypothetical protein
VQAYLAYEQLRDAADIQIDTSKEAGEHAYEENEKKGK